MQPQPWGHACIHQRLCDGRGVCVLRVSQVVAAVPVSIRVRMTARSLEMPALNMSANGRSRIIIYYLNASDFSTYGFSTKTRYRSES